MPTLIPYKAEHLLAITDRDSHVHSAKTAVARESGPAFTAIVDDIIIGCGGIIVPWEGVGYAWVVFSPHAAKHFIWCSITVKRSLYSIKRSLNLHRIELVVLEGFKTYERWAEWLGFNAEEGGRAQLYTSDKQNARRFELI